MGKTAQSYADGLQHSENRKRLLLEALGKGIDRMSEETDAFSSKSIGIPTPILKRLFSTMLV